MGEEMVKVALFGPDGRVETVWAVDLGEGRYQLRNLPFHSFGIAFDDVFTTVPSDSGFPTVAQVVARSGHSAYRLAMNPGRINEDFERRWAPLQTIGCTYERATAGLLAVDIPPSTDLNVAYQLLEAGTDVWDFEEVYAHTE